MSKIKLALNSLTAQQLVAFANTVKTAMTGNANFTTPNPTLVVFGGLITAAAAKIATYDVAKAAAETALADRDAALAVLRASFTQLGDYVQNVTAGDTVKIESAAIPVRTARAPVTMTQVQDLAATAGDNPGSLDAMWHPISGASSYEVQLNTGDPNVAASWAFARSTSKSTAAVSNLTSGAKVWLRVRAIGGNDQSGPWSDPATKVVP